MRRSERWRQLSTAQRADLVALEGVIERVALQLRKGAADLSVSALAADPLCGAVRGLLASLAGELELELEGEGGRGAAAPGVGAGVEEVVGGLVDAVSGFMGLVDLPQRRATTPPGFFPSESSLALLANQAVSSVIHKQGASAADGSYLGTQFATHIKLLWDSLEVMLSEAEGLRTMGSHGALVGLLDKVVTNLKRVRSEGQ